MNMDIDLSLTRSGSIKFKYTKQALFVAVAKKLINILQTFYRKPITLYTDNNEQNYATVKLKLLLITCDQEYIELSTNILK